MFFFRHDSAFFRTDNLKQLIASHVIDIHRKDQTQSLSKGEIDSQFLRKYIAFCRQFVPHSHLNPSLLFLIFSSLLFSSLLFSSRSSFLFSLFCTFSSKAQQVASEFGERNSGVDTLKQLLSHPLIHFSKYESKLRSIQQTFGEDDEGANGIHAAIELIGAASDLIKSKFEVAKRRIVAPVLAFEARLEVEEPLLLLRSSNRRLIREGNCKIERKNCFAVLFNDMFIITEPTGTGNGLRPLHIIEMQDATLPEDKGLSKTKMKT